MKITLIGAGNVGYHLGKRLFKKQLIVQQVYSRTLANASHLAKAINAKATDDLSKINDQSDIYILSVKDDFIATVAEELAKNASLKKKLFVHTSGAISSTVLKPYFKKYGVFYPLQTFSKSKQLSFKNIPICINAKKRKDQQTLFQLGNKISQKVQVIKDEERAILHVAAVFVNNFTNHLFHIAHQICEQEQLDFDLLKPLIEETVDKIKVQTPYDMQTGPGRRGDKATTAKHLAYLNKNPAYRKVYRFLSEQIERVYE